MIRDRQMSDGQDRRLRDIEQEAFTKGKTMFKEFKEFAIKGNAVDLAVGLVIGAAFGAIVASLVKDILMPPIGLLAGGVDFSNMFILLQAGKDGAAHYPSLKAAQDAGAVTMNIGLFINTLINFLIIAFSVFMIVRALQRLKRPQPTAAPVAKDCPFCAMTIPLKAMRCPHCTSEMADAGGSRAGAV
jgi:large conductance mechanosensitive channel